VRERTRGIDVIVPRHRLDISLADLGYALLAALFARNPERRARRVAHSWAAADGAIACASVRSALDCLLSALDLRAGGEVLVSAITHPDVPRIIAAHGLVAVPVDVDAGTMAPRLDELERALTPRTRIVLVAHLFGGRFDLAHVAEFTRRHELLLVEDCAQTILGSTDSGDPRADVSLYSFGSIKTATALGGALVRVRERELLQRMRDIEGAWPRQPRREHAAKSLKYMALIVLDRPLTFTLLVRLARLVGLDVDRFVSQTVRAFKARPGENADDRFSRWLRRRPSAPLLALLERRLGRFDAARLDARRRAGALVAAALPPDLERPGRELPDSTHWVFPVVSQDPELLVHALQGAGFDVAQGTSAIQVVEPPSGRDDIDPTEARRLMAGIVFLPVYPELSDATLTRLATSVGRAERRAGAPPVSETSAVPA
jgi:dTDP-4-amino-4,6-dideoxygalactose transaminase